MIGVSAWVMLLATVRDRAALVMAFLLPPLLFIVFAAIFSGTTGKDLKLKVGLLDAAQTTNTERFVKALKAESTIRLVQLDGGGEAAVTDLVRHGTVDVGILLRGDLERRPDQGPSPILVIENATRPLAGVIAQGEVQRTMNEKLPDVALTRILADVQASGAIAKEDQEVLTQAFHDVAAKQSGKGFDFARVVESKLADQASADRHGNVLYYAAAVSAIFLLFGAVHGGLTLVDERNSGIAERLMLSRGGMASMVAGKLMFLVCQGTLQAVLVYAVAALIYHATFDASRIGAWLASCVLGAAASAGLALLICALCRSRKQAESLTTFVVLLVSAAGGSMVPRYLMPPWFQQIGWFTPNAWMIEALERAVLPGTTVQDLAMPWGVLAGTAVVAGAIATGLATRRRAN